MPGALDEGYLVILMGQVHQSVGVQDGVTLSQVGHLIQDQKPAEVDGVHDLKHDENFSKWLLFFVVGFESLEYFCHSFWPLTDCSEILILQKAISD